MTPKQMMYQSQANTIIQNLEKRNISGYYSETKEEALSLILSKINDGASVSWGGSQTLGQIGLYEALESKNLTIYDRARATTPEETKQLYRAAFGVDYYFMSTNAITFDGVLVNIDGNSNRVAALTYGPEHVYIIVGMNKVCSSLETALERAKNFAAPANTQRLNCKTPCVKTGHCHNCLVDDCICCNTVITRKSRHTGRIHVFFIGEELGY